MTKRRMTRQDAGELIFDVWADNVDQGMSQDETLAETGLTRKQFQIGKEWLRDTLCADKEMPYSYDPVSNVYRLNMNFEPVEEYWLYRLSVTAKQLRRLLDGTASPAKSKFGGKKVNRLYRHTENLVLDLEDIVQGVG